MKNPGKTLFFCIIGLLVLNAAGDISGQWHAEFDTQIGTQKYTFTFKSDGTNISGHAAIDLGGGRHNNNSIQRWQPANASI